MNKYLTPILLTLSMAIWGMSFVWSKIAFEYLPPVSTILSRLLLSSAFLWIWLLIKGQIRIPSRRNLRDMLILSFLQPFLYFIGESFGLQRSSAIVSAIIIALIPVFTPVIASIFNRERLRKINIVGLLISFAGVAIMVSTHGFRFEADLAGILLLMLAVVSAVAYTIWAGRISLSLSSLEVIAWQNSLGVLLFLPIFFITDYGHIPLQAPDSKLWISILSLSILASSLAFIFYFDAVRKLGPSRANVFSNLIPVFTAILAWSILGEEISTNKIIGMAAVISGVALTQSRKSHKPAAQ